MSVSATRPVHGSTVLVLGLASTITVLVAFVFTTLVDEPGTAVALVVILVLCIVLDLGWKHVRDGRAPLDATPAIGG